MRHPARTDVSHTDKRGFIMKILASAVALLAFSTIANAAEPVVAASAKGGNAPRRLHFLYQPSAFYKAGTRRQWDDASPADLDRQSAAPASFTRRNPTGRVKRRRNAWTARLGPGTKRKQSTRRRAAAPHEGA